MTPAERLNTALLKCHADTNLQIQVEDWPGPLFERWWVSLLLFPVVLLHALFVRNTLTFYPRGIVYDRHNTTTNTWSKEVHEGPGWSYFRSWYTTKELFDTWGVAPVVDAVEQVIAARYEDAGLVGDAMLRLKLRQASEREVLLWLDGQRGALRAGVDRP